MIKLHLIGSSDDDNSSSGCSSSGALRHIIITPPRDTSSVSSRQFGLDESQQSQQSRMLSSRNSFSPYNIRPLVIRSKRKITVIESHDLIQYKF